MVVTKECIVNMLVEKLELAKLMAYLFKLTRWMKIKDQTTLDDLLAYQLWSLTNFIQKSRDSGVLSTIIGEGEMLTQVCDIMKK